MTLDAAFKHFTKSDTFKSLAKQKDSVGGKLRGYKTRYEHGALKEKAVIKLLTDYGYSVKKTFNVQPPK